MQSLEYLRVLVRQVDLRIQESLEREPCSKVLESLTVNQNR